MPALALKETHSVPNFRRLRDEWLASVDLPDKEERLFELETQLKALDRFFNLDNLPLSQTDLVITRDFSIEIRVVAHACRRVARAARTLLQEEASAFTFRSYVENQMLSDRARDSFNSEHIHQETPAESLFLLGGTFQNLADITQALTRLNAVSYPLFVSIGQMVSRAIAENTFFNPMAGDHFNAANDKIKIPAVAQLVRSITEKELRKEASIALLALFRLMRYLSMVKHESEKRDELRQALLVLGLIHSDSRMFIHFLEKEIPERLGKQRKSKNTAMFLEVTDSLAFQLNMELRKVHQQILRDVLVTGSIPRLRSAVASGVGILRNFFEQSVMLLVQTFDPTIRGRTIFPNFTSKVEQSMRLREDIWVLNKVCDAVEQNINREDLTSPELAAAIAPLTNFIDYFLGLSYKFVRFADHDEFERFFILVKAMTTQETSNPHRVQDFKKKVGYFNRFVETTLGQIRHREELQDVTLDTGQARRLLDQFIH